MMDKKSLLACLTFPQVQFIWIFKNCRLLITVVTRTTFDAIALLFGQNKGQVLERGKMLRPIFEKLRRSFFSIRLGDVQTSLASFLLKGGVLKISDGKPTQEYGWISIGIIPLVMVT
ncbi:hypothetical protein M9H77_26646 [Catharanthus roseus]|uniref:Uncharacterized protein n=1 Tax=Catharanthus roseus TaxID=4058 RepID=A0ACC0AAA4_CATRO|nr:hypothetical protein M9H77_26646 [Catharanthus roseus]